MIRMKNLKIGFKAVLLEAEHIELQRGEIYALIGANGRGKTTFLKTLNGAIHPLNGTLEIDKYSYADLSREQLAQKIAFVSSKFEGVDHLSVYQYVALGRTPFLGLFGRLSDKDHKIVNNALEKLGLSHFSDRITSELSDGERQLASIARALAQDCPVITLDEPTAFLDYLNKQKIIELLVKIASEQNKCLLFSTHDLDLIDRMKIPVLLIQQNKKIILKRNIETMEMVQHF